MGGIIFLAALALILWYIHYTRPIYIPPSVLAAPPAPAPANIQNVTVDADARYRMAPRPERLWQTEYEIPTPLSRIPIGISTQGLPETYQSMGIIKTSSGQMLPLYGRRTVAKSDRFQYYTRSDTANPIPLPIQYKRRDCQDDIGCDELFSGESVKVLPTNEEGNVTIYRFSGPTYIPGLI
jgi:hypothetical protein